MSNCGHFGRLGFFGLFSVHHGHDICCRQVGSIYLYWNFSYLRLFIRIFIQDILNGHRQLYRYFFYNRINFVDLARIGNILVLHIDLVCWRLLLIGSHRSRLLYLCILFLILVIHLNLLLLLHLNGRQTLNWLLFTVSFI